MKIGDIVRVKDGSYSMVLIKGKMQCTTGIDLRFRRLRVCGVSGLYPTDYNSHSSISNDILLVDVDDFDFVLFSQERFCRVVAGASVNNQRKALPKGEVEIVVPHGVKQVHLILR